MVYKEDSANPDITLGELLLVYFEWMSVHKVTEASAKAVYTIMLTILPKDSNAGSWAKSKALLKKICDTRAQKIDTCPNDHIAFYDCQSPKLSHYKHSHRRSCPVCGADRWLYGPNGKRRAAKTVYHLPVGPWLRDLFRDPELAKYLNSEVGTKPPGHVTKSRGWYDKVQNHGIREFLKRKCWHNIGMPMIILAFPLYFIIS